MPRQTTSQEYWKKREEEALNYYLTSEEEYLKRINSVYDYMLDQITKEINGFYAQYAKTEGITMAEAKRRAAKLDMEAYSRKAEKYVKEKNFTAQANAEMRLYNMTMKVNRLELLKANIGLETVSGFDELEKYYGDILTERTLEEFERQAGILGESIGDNAKAASAIVNSSFGNARYSDRIWMYQDMLKSELSKLLSEGLIQGRHPNELARHLQKLFGVQKSYAERLMRTELARVQIGAQEASYKRNGYEQYMFIATHDSKTCSVCAALDGEIFNVKDMLSGTNAPPMHPNCRCSTVAYVEREEFEKRLGINKASATSSNASNSGVDNINNQKDYNSLSKYFKKNYNIDIDKGVHALDFESVREGLEGVERIFKEFPQAQSSFIRISTSSDGVMCAEYNGTINFNPAYYNDRQSAVRASQSTGFHPKGNNVMSTGAHEAGHILEKALIDKNNSSSGIIEWISCARAKAVVSEACKNAKKTPEGKGKRNAQLESEISKYALSTKSECMAEAVADYFLNGNNASILSREIWKILKRELG